MDTAKKTCWNSESSPAADVSCVETAVNETSVENSSETTAGDDSCKDTVGVQKTPVIQQVEEKQGRGIFSDIGRFSGFLGNNIVEGDKVESLGEEGETKAELLGAKGESKPN